MITEELKQAIAALKKGGVIAYPTEAVFGLGCDPDNIQAISQLLTLKSRPKEKGLILIASHWQQLQPYVDFNALTPTQLHKVLASWPGAYTWVLPKTSTAKIAEHQWISGQFNSIAVRVSAHPLVQQLCQQYNKAIVSTSANLTGQPPATTATMVEQIFRGQLDYILAGKLGGRSNPSTITDAISGKQLRS